MTADGSGHPSPPDSHCTAARGHLLTARAQEGTGIFELAFEDCIEIDEDAFPDPRVRAAIHHVQGCAACRHWRSTEFAPLDMAYLARARQYCCQAMFRAADHPAPPLVVSVERQGPEQLVYWLAGPELACIDFCPWCGTRLPRERVPDSARVVD